MPTYSYFCNSCFQDFETFCNIKDYTGKAECPSCTSHRTTRKYREDVATLSSSVKKGDSELKTIGDLAQRNTERMSNDQKAELHDKHNSYKYQESEKKLPAGMSRMKKPPKTQWTD